MPHNLLKHGSNKLIKSFINLLILSFLLFAKLSVAEQILKIGILQFSEKFTTKQILQDAYKKLNINVEFIYLPAERSLRLANEGILDGEGSRIAGLEKIYPNLIRVSIPIETITLYAFSKNATIKIQGWDSLKPYHIVYLRGVKVIEKNLLGFNAEGVTDIKQAFMMLEHNRADIVIADNNQAILLTKYQSSIKQLKPAIYTFPVYHYLNKKHIELVPKLEVIFKQISKDYIIKTIK